MAITYGENADAAHEVTSEIIDLGGSAFALQADLSDGAQVERLFREVDEFGTLCGLVNNAGILESQARLDEMDGERLAQVFAVNITGSFLCAREAVRRMSNRHGGGGGAIVNLSSAASRLRSPHEFIDYAASKGAIDTFTLGLAREVAAEGIRVNAVRPGLIYTDIHASGGDPDRVDWLASQVPIARGAQPKEVARAILWLLSEEASYTTGALLDVTGGR